MIPRLGRISTVAPGFLLFMAVDNKAFQVAAIAVNVSTQPRSCQSPRTIVHHWPAGGDWVYGCDRGSAGQRVFCITAVTASPFTSIISDALLLLAAMLFCPPLGGKSLATFRGRWARHHL